MRRFEVEWDESVVTRVREQVRSYAIPAPPIAYSGWRYGCDSAYLQRFLDYWVDGFDASAAVADLNRFPQFVATVDGVDLHFVHVVGEAAGRRPLLLVHGWPGSVHEFWNVVEPLAYPSRTGGRPEDAFDLVIPSLPGFGPSGKTSRPVGPSTTARYFDLLMREVLGYRRYLAQGGDWGGFVTAWLALNHATSLRGIHLNTVPPSFLPPIDPQHLDEAAWKTAGEKAAYGLSAYAHLQATKPQSLAYAVSGNPAAQAAWILERFHDWSDLTERPFEDVFPFDTLLTTVMSYVMNDAFVSATYFYAGAIEEGAHRPLATSSRIDVPTAVAAYRDPYLLCPPRSLVQRRFSLTRYTPMPRGGHFAALEAPREFVSDLREWNTELPEEHG
ncbi:epoxide hydrolase family protein [Saccharopolyspora shandongensis]|uniref:epoxide hydrolase family protein n=1 Tax=Saccharopolyspora shandongensis TaxID=418495 RepID=UPI003408A518